MALCLASVRSCHPMQVSCSSDAKGMLQSFQPFNFPPVLLLNKHLMIFVSELWLKRMPPSRVCSWDCRWGPLRAGIRAF